MCGLRAHLAADAAVILLAEHVTRAGTLEDCLDDRSAIQPLQLPRQGVREGHKS